MGSASLPAGLSEDTSACAQEDVWETPPLLCGVPYLDQRGSPLGPGSSDHPCFTRNILFALSHSVALHYPLNCSRGIKSDHAFTMFLFCFPAVPVPEEHPDVSQGVPRQVRPAQQRAVRPLRPLRRQRLRQGEFDVEWKTVIGHDAARVSDDVTYESTSSYCWLYCLLGIYGCTCSPHFKCMKRACVCVCERRA